MKPDAQQMLTEGQEESSRILFLPANPHDANTATDVFADAGIDVVPCETLSAILDEIERGAGVLLVAEERLDGEAFDRLIAHLKAQPAWSDIPILVVTQRGHPGDEARTLSEIANVTLVERPVHFKPLVSTVRAALRDRRRQYDIRRSIANRDRFLAMLGHELRNPLAAIILAFEQLDMHLERHPALEIIRRQSANLERIVDDLLEVSRISRGAISFDKECVDLIEIVRETVEAFRGIAAEQDLGLTVELPDRPLWVYGDSVRLEQVLGNLLSNAIRYTPSGGKIEVSAEQDGRMVDVSVRDSGMGIPSEKIDKIFELFAQAHDDFSRREGGLGLGLSLAHSIMQRHDGEIIASSDGEGEGSKFSMRLPPCDAPVQSSSRRSVVCDAQQDGGQSTQRAEQESSLRLLVVEDVDDVRTPFCAMLRMRGYTVEEAATGKQALEAAHGAEHDVILLDIGLPDIDGFEVARRLRDAGCTSKIIALTGYGRQQDRDQAKSAGFDALLTKPVSLGDLEKALPEAVAEQA